MKEVILKEVADWPESPGEYLFDAKGRVILACPKDGTVFLCKHKVEQKSPLTLSPSVVGPGILGEYTGKAKDQILSPCMHHFWVKEGKALDII